MKTQRPKTPLKKQREALLRRRMAEDLKSIFATIESHKVEHQRCIIRAAWELISP